MAYWAGICWRWPGTMSPPRGPKRWLTAWNAGCSAGREPRPQSGAEVRQPGVAAEAGGRQTMPTQGSVYTKGQLVRAAIAMLPDSFGPELAVHMARTFPERGR